MDKERLMQFLSRILSANHYQTDTILKQFIEILENDKVDEDLINIVRNCIKSLPEATEIAKKQILSEHDVEIAVRKAEERIRKEEEERRGRC